MKCLINSCCSSLDWAPSNLLKLSMTSLPFLPLLLGISTTLSMELFADPTSLISKAGVPSCRLPRWPSGGPGQARMHADGDRRLLTHKREKKKESRQSKRQPTWAAELLLASSKEMPKPVLMWHLLSSCPALPAAAAIRQAEQPWLMQQHDACLPASHQLQPLLRIIGSLIGQSWDERV